MRQIDGDGSAVGVLFKIHLCCMLNGYQKIFGICIFKEMEVILLQVPSYC